MSLRLRTLVAVLALLIAVLPAAAQYYQSDFPPEEFKDRWQKMFDRIGNNAVAVLQGMPNTDGFIFPRQYNSFYYLSGIETIYAEFSPPEGAEQSRGEFVSAETARATDYWDGGVSRQRRFVELLRVQNPRTEIRDLNPILDELRSIKSPREIALIKRASQIAGLGLMGAMRSTEPGVTEYQLDGAARYVFLIANYRGPLKPQVFSVDPQLRVPEENLYLRYEDTVVITETGVENFTGFLHSELAEIEKLVQEKGVVQKTPPIPVR